MPLQRRLVFAAFNVGGMTSPTILPSIVCTDELDETASTRKWSKKAADQLEKLNDDCNRTAGLEAKLELAVGARVNVASEYRHQGWTDERCQWHTHEP